MHFEPVGVGEVWASLKNYEEKESGDIMIPGEVGLAVSCQLGLRSARDVPLSAPVLPPNLCKGGTLIQLTGRPTACWPSRPRDVLLVRTNSCLSRSGLIFRVSGLYDLVSLTDRTGLINWR